MNFNIKNYLIVINFKNYYQNQNKFNKKIINLNFNFHTIKRKINIKTNYQK